MSSGNMVGVGGSAAWHVACYIPIESFYTIRQKMQSPNTFRLRPKRWGQVGNNYELTKPCTGQRSFFCAHPQGCE